MNRQQRRAEAARTRPDKRRAEAIAAAVAYLGTVADQSVTGATVILPSGELLHLTAETVRVRKRDGEAVQ